MIELLALCERANPERCWRTCGVGAEVPPQRCWSPPGTTPSGCAAKRRSPRSAGPSIDGVIRAQGPPPAGHTAAATAQAMASRAVRASPPCGLRVHERSIDYAARRRAEGKTRREIIRCLKRHTAREIYRLLTDPPQSPTRREPDASSAIAFDAMAHHQSAASSLTAQSLEPAHSNGSTDYIDHYNRHRPHRCLNQRPPTRPAPSPDYPAAHSAPTRSQMRRTSTSTKTPPDQPRHTVSGTHSLRRKSLMSSAVVPAPSQHPTSAHQNLRTP